MLSWHYQWPIENEFLPVLVGRELMDELRAGGPRYYRPDGEPYIPVEFADAGYRYGHSQIRQLYRLQPDGPALPVFPDLIGFYPIGRVPLAGRTRPRARSGDRAALRLGEVGGLTVSEVLVGVIASDPESYPAVDPGWSPTLPGHESRIRLRDLLVPVSD